jgi:hypothetical protein
MSLRYVLISALVDCSSPSRRVSVLAQVGSKNPSLATQKELRAAVLSERKERRSRIRAAVQSFVFPEANNQGLEPADFAGGTAAEGRSERIPALMMTAAVRHEQDETAR